MAWSTNCSFDSSSDTQHYSPLRLDTQLGYHGLQTPSSSATDSRRPSCTFSATPESLSFSSGYAYSQPPTPANSTHVPELYNSSFSSQFSQQSLHQPLFYNDDDATVHPNERMSINLSLGPVDEAWYSEQSPCTHGLPMYQESYPLAFRPHGVQVASSNVILSQDAAPLSPRGTDGFSEPSASYNWPGYSSPPNVIYSLCDPAGIVEDVSPYPQDSVPIKHEASPSRASSLAVTTPQKHSTRVSKPRRSASKSKSKPSDAALALKLGDRDIDDFAFEEVTRISEVRDKVCNWPLGNGKFCEERHTTQHKLNRHQLSHGPPKYYCPVPGCAQGPHHGITRRDNCCQHFMTHLDAKRAQGKNTFISWVELKDLILQTDMPLEDKARMVANTESQLEDKRRLESLNEDLATKGLPPMAKVKPERKSGKGVKVKKELFAGLCE